MAYTALEQQLYHHLDQTPLEESAHRLPNGQPLALKHETERASGSFKALGMFAAVLTHGYEKFGLTSAGGAGIAAAYAAAKLERTAHIYLPESAPASKKATIRAIGGEAVTLTELPGDFPQVQAQARTHFSEHDIPEQSPYDDPAVIEGHSVVAKEVLRQAAPGEKVFFVPVGGGSLLAGTLEATAATGDRVVGVQYSANTSLHQSLAAGTPVAPDSFDNRAEGTAAVVGSTTLEVIQKHRDRLLAIVTVTPEEVGASIAREMNRRYQQYEAPYPNRTVEPEYRFPETTGFIAETGAWQYARSHQSSAHDQWVALRTGSNTDPIREQALLDAQHASSSTPHGKLHGWNGAHTNY